MLIGIRGLCSFVSCLPEDIITCWRCMKDQSPAVHCSILKSPKVNFVSYYYNIGEKIRYKQKYIAYEVIVHQKLCPFSFQNKSILLLSPMLFLPLLYQRSVTLKLSVISNQNIIFVCSYSLEICQANP